MFNANVVDFPSYSALLMARTAIFLEQLAEAVFVSGEDFDAETGNSVQSFHVGLGVLKTWLRILLDDSSAIQS